MSGTRKRVRDVLAEEGIETKHLKVYFNTPKKETKKESKETLDNVILKYDKEPSNNSCKDCKQKFDELNRKFDSMITLQAKLISLLEDIDYRFNDKGQMLSYIS